MDQQLAVVIAPARVADPRELGGLEHSGLEVHRVRGDRAWVAGVGTGRAESVQHAWRRAAGDSPVVPDVMLSTLRRMLARAGWWLTVSGCPARGSGPAGWVVEVYCPALGVVHRVDGPTGVAGAVTDAVAGCLEQLWNERERQPSP